MICKEDEILIQDRTSLYWNGVAFPGGHIEVGESIVDSTIREVKEETGLEISNLKLCGIKQWFLDDVRYICFLFQTNTFIGNLKSSIEGENFWIKKSEIKKYRLATNFEDMLQVFEKDEYLELFRATVHGEKISLFK